MSLLRQSVAALNAGLRAVGGETTTYRRGNLAIDAIEAVPANVRHDEYGDVELSLTGREKDWIYWADELVLDGQRIVPARGDAIDWLDAHGVKHTYEVLPRLDDRVFRHTDPTEQQVRVYTVEKRATSE